MTTDLRVIGAGLPRTGTHSLRLALQQLLGQNCYHMSLLFERGGVDTAAWQAALDGEPVDWDAVFADCTAAVDWPVSAFWADLAERYPDALIVLSTRDSAAAWWQSATNTVWRVMRTASADGLDPNWVAMASGLMARVFGADWDDPDSAMATYDRYNATVRETAPADRLLEWNAKQGWEPLCERLGLPAPSEPFPRTNTSEEWAQRAAAGAAESTSE